MRKLKSMLTIILTIVIIYGFIPGNFQSVFAQGNNGDSETVSGILYQFGEKGNYTLSEAENTYSTNSGTLSGGQFSITGDISSVSNRNGIPEYAVSEGTLSFSYTYDDKLLKASEDEDHLVEDNGKKVNEIDLNSNIKMGALIVQTSKDGEIWFNVPGMIFTNIFQAYPDGLKEFYTTTDVQMVNGCYYRILIAYETAVRTQKAQTFPPKLEKHEHTKYAEVYSFYAYDETAIDIAVPESKNRRNLGAKVRTKSEGYVGSAAMDNDDPHFGWEIGQFFVGGFTDYEDDAEGNPIFLKNNGDRLSLWFELQQNINKCYGNNAIKVIPDTEGSDAYFEVPGGVNETTDFGRGALIVRKTNPDGTKENPQIYTNYLEASASTDAITKVDLLEEGDYEVALDYAVKFDKTRILGKSILPETAKYRIFFKFSVRNGNSMIFLFDSETGSELSSGSFTESGFRIDYANSHYLRVNVKREVLKDGFDGLAEDTRFNSVATDGDVFTEEGVYTITVTNKDLDNVDPTVKRVYVGTDNILKAYIINNLSIAEIKEMLALGATITDEGKIIPPEPEDDSTVESSEEKKTEDQASTDESETTVESSSTTSEEKTASESEYQDKTETRTETTENIDGEQLEEKAGSPIIPVALVAVVAVAGGFFFKSKHSH